MSVKKIIANFLVFLMVFITIPTNPVATADTRQESLMEFLRTTDNITATMEYPSLKLANNNKNDPRKVKLQAMTPLMIRATQTISTKDIMSGTTINFATVSDIKSKDGQTVIQAGSPVSAQVTFAKKKSFAGISGDLTISDFHTVAVDGTYVPLIGNVSQKGEEKIVLSVVLSLFICPLFLFMKGEDAQVPAGTTKSAYTATEIEIVPNL